MNPETINVEEGEVYKVTETHRVVEVEGPDGAQDVTTERVGTDGETESYGHIWRGGLWRSEYQEVEKVDDE